MVLILIMLFHWTIQWTIFEMTGMNERFHRGMKSQPGVHGSLHLQASSISETSRDNIKGTWGPDPSLYWLLYCCCRKDCERRPTKGMKWDLPKCTAYLSPMKAMTML